MNKANKFTTKMAYDVTKGIPHISWDAGNQSNLQSILLFLGRFLKPTQMVCGWDTTPIFGLLDGGVA